MHPNALCFGDDLPGAGAPCTVEVSPAGLTLRFADRPEEAVAFAALTVGAGGFDHDHLTLKWTGPAGDRTLYLKDPDLIRAVRAAAPPELLPHVEQTAARVRRVRTSRRTWLLTGIAIVAGLIVIMWMGADPLTRFAAERMPIEWEKAIGEAARTQFLAGQTVVKEGPAVEAVQEITKRLVTAAPNNPYTFDVTVVRSDVVNAFALPGGYVVVFTGLLKKAESPEEVAGVLGHELNHVLLRHGMERIVKTIGIMAVVTILVGDQQGLVGLAKRLGIELATLKFGREQETQADVEGLRLLHRAKIPPDGMIRFFERLSENDKLQVEILSTHPMSGGRAERLKAEAAALPKQEPEPFTFEWKAVQVGL